MAVLLPLVDTLNKNNYFRASLIYTAVLFIVSHMNILTVKIFSAELDLSLTHYGIIAKSRNPVLCNKVCLMPLP